MSSEPNLESLNEKLRELIAKHNAVSADLRKLNEEFHAYKLGAQSKKSSVAPVEKQEEAPLKKQIEISERQKILLEKSMEEITGSPKPAEQKLFSKSNLQKSNFEKFVGENLLSKIGIVVLVIGVGIGAKYSIDHQLISPLTRIILGYLVGASLLLLGMKLKNKYLNFSAVLVSGSMASMYFVTYAGHVFYNLYPQVVAFILMVIFTAFTVVAAIHYNRAVIAHIGLVGAYAVPFMLSDGSGKVLVFLSYIVLINIGILVIAFKKYWKSLYYSAFGFTWVIFMFWLVSAYQFDLHFSIALCYLFVFFFLFYAVFLAYKFLRKEAFAISDIVMLFLNSALFYGIGCGIISSHAHGNEFLGLFTLLNAVLHFLVAIPVYRSKITDQKLFHLIIGLVMTFITIAVPVQLDGNQVTMIWACEAAVMLWLAKKFNVSYYQVLSYIQLGLAVISLVNDWSLWDQLNKLSAFSADAVARGQRTFVTSIIFVLVSGIITYLHLKYKRNETSFKFPHLQQTMHFVIPAILLGALYFTFLYEITIYWDIKYYQRAVELYHAGEDYTEMIYNRDYRMFKAVSYFIYSTGFLAGLSLIHIRFIKNHISGSLLLGLISMLLLLLHVNGLIETWGLLESFKDPKFPQYFITSNWNIGSHYFIMACIGLSVFMIKLFLRQTWMSTLQVSLQRYTDYILLITACIMLSYELMLWTYLYDNPQGTKLGLTILWSAFALFTIVIGIWKKRADYRIGAMIFFGIILVKLFFYDLAHLTTIFKTIVFLSVGALLLIVSFLYNKYKHLMSDEQK